MLDLGLAVMRGERERPRVHMAYWLLAALYAFAMLGNAVAAGEGMLQDVALCIPLVTAAVPLGVGVAAGAATEAAATRLSEHVVPIEEAVAASVDALVVQQLHYAQSLKWIEPVTEELNGAALALPWRCPELNEWSCDCTLHNQFFGLRCPGDKCMCAF